MYPHSEFNLIDNSEFVNPISVAATDPFFLAAFTTDKGPEDLTLITTENAIKLFGNPSYFKHGQASIQTFRAIEQGATVLMQRIVSPTATIANAVVVAKVKRAQKQKTNALGQLIYLLDGVETIDPEGATAVIVDYAELKYQVQSVSGIKTMNDVSVACQNIYSGTVDVDGFKTYPLFIITDNGRGLSEKKFRISLNSMETKRFDYAYYQLEVFENSELLETLNFSIDYTKIHNGRNISIASVVNSYSTQLKAKVLESYVDEFITELNEASGRTDMLSQDPLFGRLKDGKSIASITNTSDSVNLSHVYGISVLNGTNGTFGNVPVDAQTLVDEELVKFYTGVINPTIYDLDRYKLDAVIDAGFSYDVKRAIENLVEFRKDLMFFRDSGIVRSYADIELLEMDVTKSIYSASYHLSYDVIDPYSKRQVNVTCGYTLAKILVDHFKNGRHRPLAGEINDAVITDAIEGTINYLPIVTPSVNQKEQLADIRVNYASYFGSRLVLESQYTSQEKLSQLSYINNVLAVQEVIKAIRENCPKNRYSFADGKDLEVYQSDVERVIKRYAGNFKKLEFVYVNDPAALQQKRYRAALNVIHRDFIDNELFDIYVLNN